MPELPADDSAGLNSFVLVSETNLTNKREMSLIFEDQLGKPLGVDDEDFDGKINTVKNRFVNLGNLNQVPHCLSKSATC